MPACQAGGAGSNPARRTIFHKQYRIIGIFLNLLEVLVLSEFYNIRKLLAELDTKTLNLFDALKKRVDETAWKDNIIKEYGSEREVPWMIWRRSLFNAIRKICREEAESSLIEQAREIYYLWILAKRELFSTLNLNKERLERVLNTLAQLHSEGLYPSGFFIWNPTHKDYKIEVIRGVFGSNIENEDLLIDALDIGYYIYDVLRTISPLILTGLILPSLDSENKDFYLKEANEILLLLKIRDYWYSFVEKRSNPDYQHWEFWEEFLRDVKKDP